ncbi:MAG: hypothetical protein Q9215_003083 [Flavoplaca cf. flavocitrina]
MEDQAYCQSALAVTLLVLVSQIHRARIPVSDVQQILATWGTRAVGGPPTTVQEKRSGNFDGTGIKPIPCHSHNDYERNMPLYDALNTGCISVEADIWLQDGELLIGHEKGSIDPARTLKSLYLDPLVSILSDRNPDLDLNDGTDHSASLKGVFSTDASTALILLIDIKTESVDSLPVLMDQLSPLRDQGLLTHFDGSQMIQGPLTVVGTGNTNFDTIFNEKDRTVFFDAPLDNDWSEDSPASKAYSKDNSYYASVSFDKSIGKPSFLGDLSDEQTKKVKDQIQGAHDRGLKVRYYDTPSGLGEKSIQEQLWKEGVDVLNRDDLKAAKEFLEKQKERL